MDAATVRWLNDDEQQTWRAFLNAAHQVEAALDRQLTRDAGMTNAQYGILVTLSEAEHGALRMGDLAAQLEFSKSRMTHAVSSLETRGWVRRQACPEDGRGQLAVLTGEGRRALVAAAPGHVEEVRKVMFDVIPPDEQAVLRTALGRVLANLEQHATPPADCGE